MVNVTVKGEVEIGRKLGALQAHMINAAQSSLAGDIVAMDADAKKEISTGSRSGKIYKRGSVRHRASSPGEFPKTDRGGLVAGFLFNVEKGVTWARATLLNRSPHARPLEFKPSSMGGRPFMRPMYRKWKPIIKRNLVNSIKLEFRRISRG